MKLYIDFNPFVKEQLLLQYQFVLINKVVKKRLFLKISFIRMYVHIKTFKGWGYHTQKKNNKEEQNNVFFLK